jgi:hypothetical protein
MTPIRASVDTEKLLGEVQKESDSIDELVQWTSQSLQDEKMECISCGKERFQHEMQKVFYKKHKGICKMCFRFDDQE